MYDGQSYHLSAPTFLEHKELVFSDKHGSVLIPYSIQQFLMKTLQQENVSVQITSFKLKPFKP